MNEQEPLGVSVAAADIRKFQRMDARFLRLANRPDVRPILDELLERFDHAAVSQLARDLPFDPNYADAVMPKQQLGAPSRAEFERWLARAATRTGDIALYVACASRFAVSKLLTEMLELSKQRLALVQKAKELVTRATDKQASALLAALKDSASADAPAP